MLFLLLVESLYVTNDEQEFVFEYGQALTNWHGVESALCQLFELYVARRTAVDLEPTPAAVAFWALEGFRPRLRVVDEVIRFSEKNPHIIDSWSSIYDRVRKLSSRRNDLAHGAKTLVFRTGEGRTDSQWRLLSPMTHATLKFQTGLATHDLREIGGRFAAAALEIVVFCHEIQGLPFPGGPGPTAATGGEPAVRGGENT